MKKNIIKKVASLLGFEVLYTQKLLMDISDVNSHEDLIFALHTFTNKMCCAVESFVQKF